MTSVSSGIRWLSAPCARTSERAMRADFSWAQSAAKYQEMYDWLIG